MNRPGAIMMATLATVASIDANGDTPHFADDLPRKNIPYADRPNCLLDLRLPQGETNFPTVVWFHGGGLSGGCRHFIPLSDAGIARYVELPLCDHGRVAVAARPYIEMLVRGKLP